MAKKKVPTASVLDRRLIHPFGSPSVAITLKEGGPWELRIVDSLSRPGRLHDMRHNKGWEFVTPEELDGSADEYGFQVRDGRCVRGENGREVLMKMPKEMYDRIVARKSELNEKAVSGKALRESAAQETALKYGSEAGDTVYGKGELTVTNIKGGENLEELESA